MIARTSMDRPSSPPCGKIAALLTADDGQPHCGRCISFQLPSVPIPSGSSPSENNCLLDLQSHRCAYQVTLVSFRWVFVFAPGLFSQSSWWGRPLHKWTGRWWCCPQSARSRPAGPHTSSPACGGAGLPPPVCAPGTPCFWLRGSAPFPLVSGCRFCLVGEWLLYLFGSTRQRRQIRLTPLGAKGHRADQTVLGWSLIIIEQTPAGNGLCFYASMSGAVSCRHLDLHRGQSDVFRKKVTRCYNHIQRVSPWRQQLQIHVTTLVSLPTTFSVSHILHCVLQHNYLHQCSFFFFMKSLWRFGNFKKKLFSFTYVDLYFVHDCKFFVNYSFF